VGSREPTERPVRDDSSQDELEQRHLVVAVFHVGRPAVIRVGVDGARRLNYLAQGGLVSLAQ
jgi:hypothetical protein